MRLSFFTIVLFILSSCLANNSLQTASVAETNVYHLSKVSLGMSEKEVLQIMRRPYSQEIFIVDQDLYDVWFYITRMTGMDQSRPLPQNLTPLTFKNSTLVGIGYDYYHWLQRKEKEARTNQQPPRSPAKEEDTSLEKALQQSESPSTPAPPPAKTKTPPKSSSVTMSSKPKKADTTPSDDEEESPPSKKKKQSNKNQKQNPLNPEDEQMIEGESEQNFNFW